MRSARFIAFSIVISITLYSCFRPNDFDEVPLISFQNLQFVEGPGNIPDSLILTIDFQDGDGNLGIPESVGTPPYHQYDFVIDANNRFVTLGGQGFQPPFDRTFLDSGPNGLILRVPDETFSEVDNRPPDFDCQFYVVDSIQAFWNAPFPPYTLDIFEFECQNAVQPCVVRDTLLDGNGVGFFQTRLDTFLIAKNDRSQNIFVDFFRKRNGEYELIDWTRIFSEDGCGTDFDGRFPIFDDDRARGGKSLEGTIRYSMQSEGFRLVLRNDTFKIQVKISDFGTVESNNVSNTVESPDLTLQQIGG